MSDLIDRQAAIDAIEDHIKAYTSTMDGYNMARRHMAELVAVLPAAQPQWIPVSERLPEVRNYGYELNYSDDVLVSEKDLYGFDRVRLASFAIEGGRARWSTPDGRGLIAVLAWMPLPEPYKS